ncbi:hypothetical protein PV411_30680 [Streptomyces sp. NRRL_B-16638]|jgi:hypothetical protein|uniref:Uncharacterized protein n=2 Tax=Streptomyces coelicolor TaxID=1902 RepID=Q99QD6_STRCO|nr:hypothetical protein [Streptomyces sp. NRRL_B-16638]AGO88535.1 hypothetical protein [Streptomyces coelicolor]MDX2928889.1 hypothetical protein [Streptomyces sp. NRRL_B-16638]CAC36593.1 hypothetical protein [Streptomyces coelicolor A3(2)]CAC36808.1 hypothetical protein [Streptomyces coelicolor A3(2)]
MAYEDCTYHGIQDGPASDSSDTEESQPARILVEKPEFGAPSRQAVTVLRELTEPETSGFHWSYPSDLGRWHKERRFLRQQVGR